MGFFVPPTVTTRPVARASSCSTSAAAEQALRRLAILELLPRRLGLDLGLMLAVPEPDTPEERRWGNLGALEADGWRLGLKWRRWLLEGTGRRIGLLKVRFMLVLTHKEGDEFVRGV